MPTKHRVCRFVLFLILALTVAGPVSLAQSSSSESARLVLSRQSLAARVSQLKDANDLRQFHSQAEWDQQYPRLQSQLLEMLGLNPMPERTELLPVIAGTMEYDDVIIERIQFQSLPGLYVTGNLYRPKDVTRPLPAVLYVCGHAQVKVDGRSLGNKTHYQHHALWFAQHDYVCLAIDTIQLGEIEGMHHGLYSFDRWDWPSRGYTPAGVEAWNSMRAIDYLVSRPEVDASRIGITGRSGGGAYSWYTAAIDPRISVVSPVAGITDLEDHILNNCITGHCDCMFLVNRYGWDFQTLAAMIAPRSLMIGNTDNDPIFPLPGVFRVHQQVRHVYGLHDINKLGIQWTSGGHDDTQELQIGTFVWFDRFLQGQRRNGTDVAEKKIKPQDLRVFDELPHDERVTSVQDWFVPTASVTPPRSVDQWLALRSSIIDEVRDSVIGRLPFSNPSDKLIVDKPAHQQFQISDRLTTIECLDVPVPMHSQCQVMFIRPNDTSWTHVQAIVPDQEAWKQLELLVSKSRSEPNTVPAQAFFEACHLSNEPASALAVITPEATGAWYWDSSDKAGLHLRRSFLLAGWSIEGRQIAGVVAAIEYLKRLNPELPISLHGDSSQTSMIALHAGLLAPQSLAKVTITDLPESYTEGFNLIGVLQRFDLCQTLTALADLVPVEIQMTTQSKPAGTRPYDSEFFQVVRKLRAWPLQQWKVSDRLARKEGALRGKAPE